MQRRLQEFQKSQTCDMKQPGGARHGQLRDFDGRARPRSTIAAVARQSDSDDVRGAGLEPLETRPHHVSGARGVAAPVSRTGQCRREWTRKTRQPGMGPQNLDLQLVRRAWPTAGGQRAIILQSKRQEKSISRSRSPRHSAFNKIVETPGATERARRPRQSRQRSMRESSAVAVGSLQYIEEKVHITAESSEASVDAAESVQREAG